MESAARSEFMIQALATLLEKGERLQMPFYGTVSKSDGEWVNWLAFIGIGGEHLLMAVLHPLDTGHIVQTMRLPLDFTAVEIKKLRTPWQYSIKLAMATGERYEIRLATKMHGGDFNEQEINTQAFMRYLNSLHKGELPFDETKNSND